MVDSKPIISLTSDFGEPFAQAQVETVIYSLNPDIKFVSVTERVTPFSILEGAFIVSKFFKFAPKGSVHIAVIDPGVGSDRRGVMIQTKNYWFIGPDNGVLYPAAVAGGIEHAYVIKEKFFNTTLLNTFHGRDIFAKAAAYISLRKDINEFGIEIPPSTLIPYSFPHSTVAHVDPYGNVKLTNVTNGFKKGDSLKVTIEKDEYEIPFCTTFADVQPGELLAYHGSHETLELAVNLNSAAKKLGIQVGDIVSIQAQTIV
jgi:S-adenosylmethionine hydrolase